MMMQGLFGLSCFFGMALMTMLLLHFVILPLLPKRIAEPVDRKFCKIGWHRGPFEVVPLPVDTDPMTQSIYAWQPQQVCSHCGYVGLVDSQGNLF